MLLETSPHLRVVRDWTYTRKQDVIINVESLEEHMKEGGEPQFRGAQRKERHGETIYRNNDLSDRWRMGDVDMARRHNEQKLSNIIKVVTS